MFPAGDDRFRVRYVALPDGTRVRAIECGDANAPRTILCIHGWACSAYSFNQLLPRLAALGSRAIAIDLPGHGLSDKPIEAARYTLDAMVRAVMDTMDALEIPRAVLVAHSMGGPIAATIAARFPDRVAALALLAPAGYEREGSVRMLGWLTPRFVAPILPYLVPRWSIALVFHFTFGRLYRPTARDVDEYWAPTQFPGFVRASWDLLHHFDWSAGADGSFHAIQTPTVVMDGSEDHMVIRRWVRRYAATMQHAHYVEVEGCGHVVPQEAPDRVIDALRPLLATD